MLKEGDPAPDFSLMGSDGKRHSLGSFGKTALVLYFYPKDETPGCTIEAKRFSSRLNELRRSGAVVVGVSADSIDSHERFASKCGINFLLLSDPEKGAIKSYDSYGDRGIFGLGTLRNTFVIGRDRRILKIFRKVRPDVHDKEVLEFLKSRKFKDSGAAGGRAGKAERRG